MGHITRFDSIWVGLTQAWCRNGLGVVVHLGMLNVIRVGVILYDSQLAHCDPFLLVVTRSVSLWLVVTLFMPFLTFCVSMCLDVSRCVVDVTRCESM